MSAYQSGPVMPSCSCSADISRIEIGGTLVGLAGLRAIFNKFHSAGRAPDPSLADELLAIVKVYNYVAPNSAEEYKVALLREYTQYWNARQPAETRSQPPAAIPTRPAGPLARIIGFLARRFHSAPIATGTRR